MFVTLSHCVKEKNCLSHCVLEKNSQNGQKQSKTVKNCMFLTAFDSI